MKFSELLTENIYKRYTELVPVKTLDKYKEFDRDTPVMGILGYNNLKADIKRNGIKEPLIIRYYKGDNTAFLTEGNHRLRIAKELGIKKVPVRVIRVNLNGKSSGKPVKPVRGFIKKDPIQHVPEDLKPSEIGIK